MIAAILYILGAYMVYRFEIEENAGTTITVIGCLGWPFFTLWLMIDDALGDDDEDR